jgi:hypothetical protein
MNAAKPTVGALRRHPPAARRAQQPLWAWVASVLR